MNKRQIAAALFLLASSISCRTNAQLSLPTIAGQTSTNAAQTRPLAPDAPAEVKKMLESLTEQTRVTRGYDPAYTILKYPNGDVSAETGVCSDVVIRALRAAGVDLQKEVHEDMSRNFAVYPKKWSLKKADSNIDHRRVPNLETFFTRRQKSLPITDQPASTLR